MARQKDTFYFDGFRRSADYACQAAKLLSEVMHDFNPGQLRERMDSMHAIEKSADEVRHDMMDELVTAFITPFDRQDISDLALAMDDIMDYMNGAALCLDLFNVQEMRGEAVQIARLTRRCVDEVSKMIDHLPNYKGDPEVMEHANMISDIEDEGDVVYNGGVRRLFHDEENGRTTVTWLRLFDRMESCIDACDHTAKVVRTVVMKSA